MISTSLRDDSVIVQSKVQVTTDLAEEAVILNLDKGVYYGLDPVGARIWSLIQEPMTLRRVQDVILEEYDVDADRCERDTRSLLEKLASEGLIEIR